MLGNRPKRLARSDLQLHSGKFAAFAIGGLSAAIHTQISVMAIVTSFGTKTFLWARGVCPQKCSKHYGYGHNAVEMLRARMTALASWVKPKIAAMV
jgi:hypothetical protein